MDVIDVAQQRQQEEIDHALAAHRAARLVAQPLRSLCAAPTCNEPISPARQRMGAQLCIDCQRDAEHRQKSWPRGSV